MDQIVILLLLLFVLLRQAKNRTRSAGAMDPAVTPLDNDTWPDYVRQVALLAHRAPGEGL
ncbi:MAG TPA: hypothetical protein VFG22_04835 [Polyangiales bacterium]|jgi:hypothetical protein|nr:hypothetical protein [Polyangiales bacterium]